MGRELVWIMLVSLLLTIIIELVVAVMVGIRNQDDIRLVVLVNVLTNPVVVLTYYLLTNHTVWNTIYIILVLEVAAVFVEGFCYQKCSKKIRHPYLLSFGLNGISYLIGKLI